MADRLEIRRLGRADIGLLEPLWRSLNDHHRQVQPSWYWRADDDEAWRRRRERYEAWLAERDSLLLVAFRGQRPVAYAVAHPDSGHGEGMCFGDRVAEVESFAVLPQERGRGAGSELLAAVAAHYAELGIETLSLGVLAANDDARRFYEREGFEPVTVAMVRGPRSDL